MQTISASALRGYSVHRAGLATVTIAETSLPSEPQLCWENPEALVAKTIVVSNRHPSQILTVKIEKFVTEGGQGVLLQDNRRQTEAGIDPGDYLTYNSQLPASSYAIYLATSGAQPSEVIVEVSGIS